MEKKKITKVEGDAVAASASEVTSRFVASDESKGKATQLRVIAAILWLLAIGTQIIAIKLLFKQPVNMMWIIILIAIDLALAVTGSVLWKKSNRLDPASEKNKFLFFMQSQLGLVVAVIAFLPLIIFILTSKNLDAKQKGILGGIAGLALVIAGVTGVDFNPPSIEQYTAQTARVEELMGSNLVYWTKSGTKYHLFNDCHSINKDATTEIFEGSVAKARELKNISELCKFCENKANKDKGTTPTDEVKEKVEDLLDTTKQQ
jgi:hypothetical protein